MAASLVGSGTLTHPGVLLPHPSILTHLERPTAVDLVALSTILVRSKQATDRPIP